MSLILLFKRNLKSLINGSQVTYWRTLALRRLELCRCGLFITRTSYPSVVLRSSILALVLYSWSKIKPTLIGFAHLVTSHAMAILRLHHYISHPHHDLENPLHTPYTNHLIATTVLPHHSHPHLPQTHYRHITHIHLFVTSANPSLPLSQTLTYTHHIIHSLSCHSLHLKVLATSPGRYTLP